MGVTETLCRYIVDTAYDDLPPEVIHEAKRALVNILGVGIGAAGHDSVDIVLDVCREVGGKPAFTVWGRKEKADLLFAALINGMAAHIFDFDDTHTTILHPSAPVSPVVFALGEQQGHSGKELLLGFVLGIETACRIANGVFPWHYEQGFHLTGTLGHFGAAAAAGKLLGLDLQTMTQALGLAATQAAGVCEMLGSMGKPFHPGKAAMNGLLAAMLVKKGFTSSKQVIEAHMGFARLFSPQYDFSKMIEGLGENYEIFNNSYKAFACGIVAQPSIDASIRLREKYSLQAGDIEAINCTVHPYTLLAMGKKTPRTGLEAKFSTYHCVAVGIIDGTAGEAQFSDERATDREVIGLRDKVTLIENPEMRKDEAIVEVRLKDGRVLKEHVEHAVGTQLNPMSDEQLNRKFREAASFTLPQEKIEALLDLIWHFEELPNLKEVAASICP